MGLFWCLFFFKQKTAYEMRISDWSSDVCSSDLAYFRALYDGWLGANSHKTGLKIIADYLLSYPIERGAIPMRDRKSVVWGKSVSVRVDLGGRRIIKKKKNKLHSTQQTINTLMPNAHTRYRDPLDVM